MNGSQSDRLAVRTLATRLSPAALREVRRGHPWVFDRSIRRIPDDGRPGDLAVVFDDARRFRAIGLYDPGSPIRIRILHAGEPETIDAAFFARRIGAADAVRAALPAEGTTGYRVVNGENDGLGGLVIDRYAHVAVIKIYSAAWVVHLDTVLAAVAELSWCDAIVVRSSRQVELDPTSGVRHAVAVGDVREPVRFTENGLVMEAAVLTGQKTGHFCDQRDNRRRVGERSAGRSVLDVFSCTGGFALHAAAGGASTVHAVDANARAIAAVERHWSANGFDRGRGRVELRTTLGNAFDVLEDQRRARHAHGVVVVDPPSFAHRADQVDRAIAAYRRLTRLAAPLVESGGWLVQASCSSRVGREAFVDEVTAAVRAAGRRVDQLEVTAHPLDHPVTFPEGEYLKAVFCRLA